MNNRVCVKYICELQTILSKSNGENVFTYKDINVSSDILKILQMNGFITGVGKKRLNNQRINTYKLTVGQRLKVKAMLENL